jgi:HK97 family phage major capsid protein
MTYNEYKEQRDALMTEAKNLIGDNEKFVEAKAKVEELDAKWDAEAKNKADLDALNDIHPDINPIVDITKGSVKVEETKPVDKFDTPEYHEAFMKYMQGSEMPSKFAVNADAVTTTTTASAVIPTTLVREILQKMQSYGNVYALCRKLNIQGGVEFPIANLKPTATWVADGKASDSQAITANDKVTFNYYTLECKIAQSLVSAYASIAEFETAFVQMATEAVVKAIELAVFKGTGSGQPLGITVDTRVTNIIEMAEADVSSWAKWKKNVFAKIPKAYRNGSFFMSQGTFEGYIDGMVDSNGQPIARVNYGIDGAETYRFGGKTVETVEDDILSEFSSASTGEVFAVFGNLQDYAINSNMQMQTLHWVDNDTNQIKDKVILIADGKVLDPNGYVVLKKKATA